MKEKVFLSAVALLLFAGCARHSHVHVVGLDMNGGLPDTWGVGGCFLNRLAGLLFLTIKEVILNDFFI